jgi:NifB/MoaA-like Fe-S oxidoreductase
LFYCADEFYIKADRDIPEDEYYEEYMQIENGVGMIRSLLNEFNRELNFIEDYSPETVNREVSIATGVASYPYISYIAQTLEAHCKGLKCHVYQIINNFFGESITVSGLLTGKDMVEQLSDKELGDELLIPENTLKADKDVFLCDMTLEEFRAKLNISVKVSKNDGVSLISDILGVNL